MKEMKEMKNRNRKTLEPGVLTLCHPELVEGSVQLSSLKRNGSFDKLRMTKRGEIS
jgi:hypothetical protein